ncbi:MAG: hypothetical protein CVV27_05260 [Candidatus Melainabacteria bacterium HGW-Melainabacteria-1]|nr:MAG: hypothetical protein CVV27_05260 [Candidatus Melainabacteria bacterium HGW-Melainabacteria-1]
MRIEANTAVRPAAPAQQAYNPYAAYPSAGTSTVAAPAFGSDSFVPTGYVPYSPNQNVAYGQGKNLGLRLLDKTLGIKSSYIEAAFIDKTPHNPMDIEEVDFNLHVKAAEVSVSDVDATLTLEQILREEFAESGKPMPIENLRVAFDPHNQVRIEGKVKTMGMRLPFSVSGQVNVDTAGQIRYDLGQAKVLGLPANGLMKAFGLTLDRLAKLRTPQDGYYTEKNSFYLNLGQTISQIGSAPGLHAQVRGVRTHLGSLQILVGDTPEDAKRVIQEKSITGPAYVKASGGHGYIDGFFLKEGDISIYDRTPGSPLNLNATGGMERTLQLHKGMVGISDQRFEELIKEEIGDSDDLTDIETSLKGQYAKVSGKLFGAIPISLNMTFSPTSDGRLMFTASGAKALGFVPLPSGLVSGQLQKVVKGGEPYGKGVALGQMSGMDLGYVRNVYHQNGYIVLESGK